MASVIDVSDKIRSSMVQIMSSVMGTLLTVDTIIKLLREKKVLKVSCLKKSTGVHPCSCKSQSLPAPDTHLTNTDSRTPCHTCMTRWVGRGGVGIRCFSNIHLRFTRPSVYKKSRQYVFEKNMVMFTPNSDQFRGIWGPPSENKNESWHKTDCCNVLSDYC